MIYLVAVAVPTLCHPVAPITAKESHPTAEMQLSTIHTKAQFQEGVISTIMVPLRSLSSGYLREGKK